MIADPVTVHSGTQVQATGGPAERGQDAVELLTVAASKENSGSSLVSESEAGSLASSGRESQFLLIDNSPLLVQDSSKKKFTSLTNEGLCEHV